MLPVDFDLHIIRHRVHTYTLRVRSDGRCIPPYIGAPLCLRHSRSHNRTIVIYQWQMWGNHCSVIRPPRAVGQYFFLKNNWLWAIFCSTYLYIYILISIRTRNGYRFVLNVFYCVYIIHILLYIIHYHYYLLYSFGFFFFLQQLNLFDYLNYIGSSMLYQI